MPKSLQKIVIADDHSLIRKGLISLLESQLTVTIFEADNGKSAQELIESEQPEIAILDVEMPFMSGVDVAKWIQDTNIRTKVIFITMYKDESMFNRALDYGVLGYVLKENTVSEILDCLRTVQSGQYYISPAISNLLIERNLKSKEKQLVDNPLDLLTQTETVIMKLLASMKTSQEIADELHISVRTVQNHRQNICNKLEISGSHALLKYSLEIAHKL